MSGVLQKCAEYWPEDTVTHEGIEITVVTVTQEDDYSLRVFTLKVKYRNQLLCHIISVDDLNQVEELKTTKEGSTVSLY